MCAGARARGTGERVYSKRTHLKIFSGVSTRVVAFRFEQRFTAEYARRLDNNTAPYLALNLVNRWLGLRLDSLGSQLTAAVAIVCVVIPLSVSASSCGLALMYAISVTGSLNWLVRASTETQTFLSCVQRVVYYSHLPIEAEVDAPPGAAPPPPAWPAAGAIEISHLNLKYRPELPLVLRDLSLSIPGGAKVGIVGRTGSGKSSLALALFRIVEPEEGSTITIDGLNIGKGFMGLGVLRERLAIIPQDPTLFSGTVRWNLDPKGEHDDATLNRALADVQLTAALPSLDEVVAEGGSGLSTGQRQLLCIARALLKNASLLILDEATSALDAESEALVQDALGRLIEGRTTVVIAHRLSTVINADQIAFVKDGRVTEVGTHESLMARKGLYYGLMSMQMSGYDKAGTGI